jgi:sigma-E factor negative regulatory protein RseB
MNPGVTRGWLMVLLVCMASHAIAGEPELARKWLEKMTTAMSQLSYQGTFVYIRDGGVETMRITHVTDQSGVKERLYSISGPQREVIRDTKGVRCVLEDAASVVEDQVVASSFFPELPMSVIDGDNSGYRLKTLGESRIAGFTAQRVSIWPTDEYRFGYDFWLEKQTGLLLKWVLFDNQQNPVAKLVFTDFAMGSDIDLDELESNSDPEDFVELKTFSVHNTVVTQSNPRWQPSELPPGFALASYSHEKGVGGVYEHMVYSDGLAAVSVYVEQNPADVAVTHGASQLGTNNAYTQTQGDLQITVIGEVPAITVQSIARQVAMSVAAK